MFGGAKFREATHLLTLSRTLALVLCAGTAWGIGMANQGDFVTVRQVSRYVPGGDAGLHIVVMGSLTFALGLAFADARFRGRRLGVWGIVALMGLFATLEEWQQMLQPYRRFSLWDLFFSLLGILLGALGVAFLKWFFARKRDH